MDDETAQPNPETDQPPAAPDASPSDNPDMSHAEQPPKAKYRFSPSRLWPRPIRNKLGRAATPLAVFVVLVILGGVGFTVTLYTHHRNKAAVINSEVVPVKRFQVTSATPTNGSKGVDDGTKITVNFNQPVNAQKLEKSFILTPTVKGTLTQGANSQQVVFTPSVPFNDTTVVTLMIDNDFQSTLGQKLAGNFTLSFTTNIPDNTVEFSQGYTYYNLLSSQSSSDQKMTLTVGKAVDPNGQLVIYKASSVDPLLRSLEYQRLTDSSAGFSYDKPSNQSVDTTGFQQLTTSKGLKDQATFDIKEPSGIYLVAAVSKGVQVGWTWAVFNDYGTVMRQDDQKIILGAYSLTDNSVPSNATVTFYNLENGVSQLQQSDLQSPQSFNFPYDQRVDAAVVTVGGDTMVVPIAVPQSLSDSRVMQDLSSDQLFYAVTDRPAYSPGDTVQFAGFDNLDNDAQFTPNQEGALSLFVASQDDPTTPLQNLSVPVSSSGVFSGQFTLNSSLSSKSGLGIYAANSNPNSSYPVTLAAFTVSSSPAANSLKVTFDKGQYTANGTIKATITATNSNGQSLANSNIQYSTYTKPYYENDPASNLQSFGSSGSQVANWIVTKLDSNGQAVVNIDPSTLGLTTTSQVVTLQAKTMAPGAEADGSSSAIVHQGNLVLHFGPGKSYFDKGQARTGRVYATDLNGNPAANTNIDYQFVSYTYNQSTQQEDPTVLASGSGTTDSNGYLQISHSFNTDDSITILANATDSSGNKVQAQYTTYSNGDSGPVMAGADYLDYLDVSGSNGTAQVGDRIPLSITAPQNMTVLVSYERGRVYKYQTVNLKQGANSFPIDVTAQMAPSFNLVFSYFVNGRYHTEGTKFVVTNPASQLSLNVTPDKSSYTAGQTASVTIKSTNGGQPVSANAIVVVQSDSEFNLNSSFQPDMLAYFYSAREYSTNSSSSLTGIGAGGGGKCGGGGFDLPGLLNNSGTTLYWNPSVTTNSSGTATVSFPVQSGKWHVSVYAMGSGASVGNTQTVITAQ